MRLEVSPRAGRTAATVKLGLAIVLVCTLLFCLVDLLGGPIYSLSTKTWLPERRGDKLIGGIEGTVKEADSATRTVRVASGFLGLGSLPVVVSLLFPGLICTALSKSAESNPGISAIGR